MEYAVTYNATTLERLIETGAFTSQVEKYINRTFRHGGRDTFYSRALAAEGRDAAERELAEWAEHRYAFAACIEPIARGVLALAKVKHDSFADITACTPRAYASISGGGTHHKFIVFNTQAPGCGCMQPQGSDIFGLYGDGLRLRAVILETGHGYDGSKAELSLVVPAWGTGRRAPEPGDFVIAKFNTAGFSIGDRYSPYVLTDEGGQHLADADTFLKYLLGMEQIDQRVGAMQTSSGIDQVIGFPGAERYLAAELPKLSGYFVDLAKKLSISHEH